MGFDFQKRIYEDLPVVDNISKEIQVNAIINHVYKAYTSIMPSGTLSDNAITYNNGIITFENNHIMSIYLMAAMYNHGISPDILGSFQYDVQNTIGLQNFCAYKDDVYVLPFIPAYPEIEDSKLLLELYNMVPYVDSSNIDIFRVTLNLPVINYFIKHIYSHMAPGKIKYVTFVPYIHKVLIDWFNQNTNLSWEWRFVLQSEQETYCAFIDFKSDNHRQCIFNNPVDDIINLCKSLSEQDVVTDLMTALMLIQTMHYNHVINISHSEFLYKIKKFTVEHKISSNFSHYGLLFLCTHSISFLEIMELFKEFKIITDI